MGTDEIFNYVMETPENTNPNVLRSLLNNLDSGTSLPDDPAQDGTYNLQNTVSSGTGTLSWASGSSGGGVLVVHEDENKALDKTWQEIHDAMLQGLVVISSTDGDNSFLTVCTQVQNNEVEYFVISNDSYVTDSPNGYPTGDNK